MNFLGAHTANMLSWWQWLLLAAVPPAIVLLYFLKLRRHPLIVPSTYLWMRSIEDLHVNSIWQRLRRNLLLLLQLLLILLVMLAVLRPSLAGRKLTGKRSIFLVDNSASMQARDVAPSRLEAAKNRVRELIAEMSTGDVAMLVSFSDVAKVEQPYTDNRRRLREALDALRPSERRTNLREALRVASGLANPGRLGFNPNDFQVAEPLPADLYIFSDGRFPPVENFALGNLTPKFVLIGTDAPANLAITALNVGRNERDASRLQTFGKIENFGPAAAHAAVELRLNQRLIDADTVDVPPGGVHGLTFDLASMNEGILELRIAADDALSLDNSASTVLGIPRKARLLVVTPGNRPLELALTTDQARELCDVRFEPPEFLAKPEYQTLVGSATFDLVVYDRCQPERMPPSNTLFIGSVPREGWGTTEAKSRMQIIDADLAHPLLQWMDLGDVEIDRGGPLVAPPSAHVLIDSEVGPLLAVAPRDAYEDAVLAFPIVEAGSSGGQALATNWPTRTSFPTFVLNVVQYLGGARRGSAQEAIRPGDSVAIEAPSSKAAITVRTPGGQTSPVTVDAQGRGEFSSTDAQGVYDVLADGKLFRQFAVNLLDPAESRIAVGDAPQLAIGHSQVAAQTDWQPARKELWKWLLVLGLFVLGLEWYVFHRRVAV